MKSIAIISANYKPSIGTALGTQAIVAVLIWRRPQAPTKIDLALIRLG